ncbi:MAG: lysylphosphatidylglycerol synthase transmembrane domain-containing protein [Nocardioidaceae bacterium]
MNRPPPSATRTPHPVVGRVVRISLSLGVAVVLYFGVIPLLAKAPWSAIVGALGSLSVKQIALLAVIWFSGLFAHSYVLTAAMPPLSHRRALALNLTGSAVSNLFPCGGAVGVSLNYAMSRTWGFSRPAFTLYTFVTNLWDVMTKLSLPALALAGLLLTNDVARLQLATIAAGALVVLVVLVLLVVAAMWSEWVASVLGRVLGRAVGGVLKAVRSNRTVDLEHVVVELRRESLALLKRGWGQLSLGMLAYSALQALLLWSCLHMLGTTLTMPEIFAGYAVERVLSLAVITPGGTGVVEVGMTALLLAFGGDPVLTVAGVLIYRAFTFGLEIPVGGVGLLVWLWRQRGRAKMNVRSAAPYPSYPPDVA